MRLRASFTVENSVIIPVFTLIIVTLILFALECHDSQIIKNAEFQMAIKTEQEQLDNNSDEFEYVLENTADYIKEKTFFGVSEKGRLVKDIAENISVKDNRQPEFIRMVNAARKLKR
jgi:hypothetical protein